MSTATSARDPVVRSVMLKRKIMSVQPPLRPKRRSVMLLQRFGYSAFWGVLLVVLFRKSLLISRDWVWMIAATFMLLFIEELHALFQRWSVARARAQLSRYLAHCAGCWYPLSGVPQQEDECVVCPECGAAWRVQAADQQSNQEVSR